jgi:hypothetical protein
LLLSITTTSPDQTHDDDDDDDDVTGILPVPHLLYTSVPLLIIIFFVTQKYKTKNDMTEKIKKRRYSRTEFPRVTRVIVDYTLLDFIIQMYQIKSSRMTRFDVRTWYTYLLHVYLVAPLVLF